MKPILTPDSVDKISAVQILETTIFQMSMVENENTMLCLLAAMRIATDALKREMESE